MGCQIFYLVAFEELLGKVRKKVSTWKASALSFAGCITLPQSILQSIHVYLLSAPWVPKGVVAKLEQLFQNFLWSKSGSHRGMTMGSWDVLTFQKRKEDLGFEVCNSFMRLSLLNNRSGL